MPKLKVGDTVKVLPQQNKEQFYYKEMLNMVGKEYLVEKVINDYGVVINSWGFYNFNLKLVLRKKTNLRK